MIVTERTKSNLEDGDVREMDNSGTQNSTPPQVVYARRTIVKRPIVNCKSPIVNLAAAVAAACTDIL